MLMGACFVDNPNMATPDTRPGLLEGRQVLVMGLASPQSFGQSVREQEVKVRMCCMVSKIDDSQE